MPEKILCGIVDKEKGDASNFKGRRPTLGGDPEFFLINQQNEIVPSEEVIPEKGLPQHANVAFTSPLMAKRDGIQAELVVVPNTCRQVAWSHFFTSLQALYKAAQLQDKRVSFSPFEEIPGARLSAMSDGCKILGCAPSLNIYGWQPPDVSPLYPFRSTGGHIHLGFTGKYYDEMGKIVYTFDDWQQRPMEPLVALLDVLVGNTLSMFDRTPQKERRKLYGRAGEYRLPSHGVEYRVPSTTYLRHYVLYSLIMGAARMGVILWWENRADELLKLVDLTLIQEAINENDPEVALANFERIEGWLNDTFEEGGAVEDWSPPLVGEKRQRALKLLAGRGIEKEFPAPERYFFAPEILVDPSRRSWSSYAVGWEKFAEEYK